MPVDFLSDEQVARYRRFRGEVTVGELEQFSRMDAKTPAVVADKRRPATKLGWAVQWGTVRMLGTFLADTPLRVPAEVVEFAAGADRWSDPRARPLEGEGWEAVRRPVLAALELEDEPAGHLAELASTLEGAYTLVLDGLGGNTTVQFAGGRLQVEKLGPLAEPPLMAEFRALIDGMPPRVVFPELLLEVFDRTGLAADFTHISGADSPMEDFAVSLCGLLVAEARNVGLVPIEKPNLPALTRARLQQVDQGNLRAETLSAANARLIAATPRQGGGGRAVVQLSDEFPHPPEGRGRGDLGGWILLHGRVALKELQHLASVVVSAQMPGCAGPVGKQLQQPPHERVALGWRAAHGVADTHDIGDVAASETLLTRKG